MNQCVKYDDKQILTDVLTHQKFMTGHYSSYLCESCSPEVRQAFSQLLSEEHNIEFEIWQEMNRLGYYPVPKAEENKVTAAKDQFSEVFACFN